MTSTINTTDTATTTPVVAPVIEVVESSIGLAPSPAEPTAAPGGTASSAIQLAVAAPSADRLAHPSAWRARADRVIAEQTSDLAGVKDIRNVTITVDGGPGSLVLRVECLMASEVVSLEVMRRLNDELPAHVEEAVGLPLSERHLELTISQYAASDAAVHAA